MTFELKRSTSVPSVLVIDSGVGGLSVCQSILASDAPLQLVYYADDAYSPYGLLDEAALTTRLQYIVSTMLALHQPDLVVLACNTVSTLLLPHLRARFEVPFVGVVPAIKPAANLSTTRCIGLLATPATVSRAYTDALIADYANDCRVVRIGSTELVVQAELLMAGKAISKEVIEQVLAPFKISTEGAAIDTIVLGCTHFPLLIDSLKIILPEVSWVDSGDAVASRVHVLLNENSSVQSSKKQQNTPKAEVIHQVYFSGKLPDNSGFQKTLCRLGMQNSQLHLLK